jgi:hypothetical protein
LLVLLLDSGGSGASGTDAGRRRWERLLKGEEFTPISLLE